MDIQTQRTDIHTRRKHIHMRHIDIHPRRETNLEVVGGLKFVDPKHERMKAEKRKREPRQKVKNDPKYVAAARELRDRWLEQVNERRFQIGSVGKYDITRSAIGAEMG